MKIAITGANGFVGQALYRHLTSAGHAVTALIRNQQIIDKQHGKCVNYNDPQSLESALKGHEVVIHLIGKTHSQDSLEALNDYQEINVKLSQTIAQASAKCDIKTFIYLSSIKAIGEAQSAPYSINSTPAPISAYGISKLEAEQALQIITKNSGMKLVVIRPPLIYSPNAKGNIALLKKVITKRLPLPLKSINNKRSIVTLDDLCRIVENKLSPKEFHSVLLPVSPPSMSTPELVQRIAKDITIREILFPLPTPLLKFTLQVIGQSEQYDKLCENLEVLPNIIIQNERVKHL